jgi:hypothetical protein
MKMNVEIAQEQFDNVLREEIRAEVRRRIEFAKDMHGGYGYVCEDKLSPKRIDETLRSMLIEIHGDAIIKNIKKALNSDELQTEVVSYIAEKLKDRFED